MTDDPAARPAAFGGLLIATLAACLVPLLLFGALAPLIGMQGYAAFFLTLVGAGALGLIAWWAIRRDGWALEDFAFDQEGVLQAAPQAGAAWALFAVLFALIIVTPAEVGQYWGDPGRILLQWLVVGMAEELLFRGYMLRRWRAVLAGLAGWKGTALALVLTNLVFALWHVPQRLLAQQLDPAALAPGLVQLFIVGLLLSYFYLRSRNIVFTGLVHGGLNAPLLGISGDFTPVIALAAVMEGWRFWTRRQARATE